MVYISKNVTVVLIDLAHAEHRQQITNRQKFVALSSLVEGLN